jgi:hypothetical protein
VPRPALRPALGRDWDSVGLVTGDPDQPVRRVLLAVDPVQAVVDEAVDVGCGPARHASPAAAAPRALGGSHRPKGRAVTALVRAGVALHVAHTNADVADPGCPTRSPPRWGWTDLRPLQPLDGDPLDKLVTFRPRADAERVVDALAAAGAGRIGDYERCAFTSAGTGTFTPLAGADPRSGRVGEREQVAETRIEMVLARHRRTAVVAALRSAHPYEEPAFDLVELVALAGAARPRPGRHRGRRRTLADFAEQVAAALPATAAGVRVGGDPDRPVRTVAVCGGAGDDLFAEVRAAGVDAYVTADLRHHPASEALEHGGPGWST